VKILYWKACKSLVRLPRVRKRALPPEYSVCINKELEVNKGEIVRTFLQKTTGNEQLHLSFRTGYRRNPVGISIFGKTATKSPRKVLKSSPRVCQFSA
jgi:hypothetical protein